MSLFARKKKAKDRVELNASNLISQEVRTSSVKIEEAEIFDDAGGFTTDSSFYSLGLCDWLLESCREMGFKVPTPVQKYCIPQILKGKDILGCAETGSGKTAAFALPILHTLSKDPYGIYAVIVTPTRELAIQIYEQFKALGAKMSIKAALAIGGMNFIEQGIELNRYPHVVIATPGRLSQHLEGPSPPNLSKIKYLVFDEADRLLSIPFQKEIGSIISCIKSKFRQTLLFSATMTKNLSLIETLSMTSPVKYDLTKKATVPRTLTEEYVFMPKQVKACFLLCSLQKLAHPSILGIEVEKKSRNNREQGDRFDNSGARRIIIFAPTCYVCQEHIHISGGLALASLEYIAFIRHSYECILPIDYMNAAVVPPQLCEVLLLLKINCVCLHSLMTQKRRLAALGKFKSSTSNVLVSTDVCSRGLDIPDVDLVINYNVPKVATDYVHRVGRTARAGNRGRSLSLVSQHDVELVQNIEKYTGNKMTLCKEIKEVDILKLMTSTLKAMRLAKMELLRRGFDEEVEKRKQWKLDRKRKEREDSE